MIQTRIFYTDFHAVKEGLKDLILAPEGIPLTMGNQWNSFCLDIKVLYIPQNMFRLQHFGHKRLGYKRLGYKPLGHKCSVKKRLVQ